VKYKEDCTPFSFLTWSTEYDAAANCSKHNG